MLSQTQINSATLDAEIAALGANLATLQNMARSFPVGVPLSEDKREAFDALYDTVATQFEHVACSLEVAGIPAGAMLF